jgi:porphobilinogen synthase
MVGLDVEDAVPYTVCRGVTPYKTVCRSVDKMLIRPRRLRTSAAMRELTRETRISKQSLIYPVFIREGSNISEEIPYFYGQRRYSPDRLPEIIESVMKSGVKSFLLFGVPDAKDDVGSGAYDDNGIVQRGVRELRARFPEIQIITDVCLCEYTSHGHCGLIHNETVDNDATLPLLAQTALSHVRAGADIVAPSDMMDGRVRAIRDLLDQNGYGDKAVMSYAVKYASAFYGPFREAAGSSPSFGDRKSYQMDYHNKREAVREALLDVEEGADFLIVKPALAYLDVIAAVRESVNLPVASYNISGEFAMIKAAAAAGFIDEESAFCEIATSIYRAGADILITYSAPELAKWIDEGRIG